MLHYGGVVWFRVASWGCVENDAVLSFTVAMVGDQSG